MAAADRGLDILPCKEKIVSRCDVRRVQHPKKAQQTERSLRPRGIAALVLKRTCPDARSSSRMQAHEQMTHLTRRGAARTYHADPRRARRAPRSRALEECGASPDLFRSWCAPACRQRVAATEALVRDCTLVPQSDSQVSGAPGATSQIKELLRPGLLCQMAPCSCQTRQTGIARTAPFYVPTCW